MALLSLSQISTYIWKYFVFLCIIRIIDQIPGRHCYSELFRISSIRESVCSSVILEPWLELRMRDKFLTANEKLGNKYQPIKRLCIWRWRLTVRHDGVLDHPLALTTCEVCLFTYCGNIAAFLFNEAPLTYWKPHGAIPSTLQRHNCQSECKKKVFGGT